MNSARQVMQMALDALEYVVEQGGGPVCEHETGGAVCFCKENEAINALRAALQAAPAQPVNQALVDAFAKLAKRHGLTLVKTADGYDLLKLGDAQAQAQPSVEDPRENPYFQQLALEAKSSL